MNKTLICYFSASGVTKNIAENISDIINGDLFGIEPVQKYSDEDLDWTNRESRSTVEMSDKKSRPQIKNKVNNIEEYDTILLGFPIWWDVAPRIINTFIEENDLNNKKIYTFSTSGGSSEENSFNDLKNTYNNLNFINSKLFFGSENEDDINEWLKR